MLISDRCRKLSSSITLEIAAQAQQLRNEGHEIISMNAGEPDFDTPLHIKAAAMEAIQEGKSKYTAVAGTPKLRAAIVKKLEKENELTYTVEEVMASTGGKQAIYNALMATIDKGDEVIISSPYWTSYPEMIKMAEGRPVILETNFEQDYKINPLQLKSAITPYTKMIILNSPCNPTGIYYSEPELQAIANILVEYPKIIIMTDDVYEKILYSDLPFKNIVNVVPSLADRTIIINSLSKSYAMTGWRLGYAAGPKEIIKAMAKIQSQSTSNPCSITQAAAIEALGKLSKEPITEMQTKYTARHTLACERLNKIPGTRYLAAEGAFYLLPDVTELIKMLGLDNDVELTKFLLDKAKVSVVPGSAFGAPNHIRLSFATNKTNINKAFDNIEKALETALNTPEADSHDGVINS